MGTAALERGSFALARDRCSGLEISGSCAIEVRRAPFVSDLRAGLVAERRLSTWLQGGHHWHGREVDVTLTATSRFG
jgi:hypothetical protein